jgi:hypothetical protein
MKRVLLLLVLLIYALPSFAGEPSFNERIELAKLAERSPEARDYASKYIFPAMATQMSKAMQACLAIRSANKEPFVLVADLQNSGALAKIDFEPKTNTAACFATQFKNLHLPSAHFIVDAQPIYFEMSLE